MKCDIILRKLLVQLFAVLSVTLFISGLNVNKSYAYTLDEYVSYLENHANEITENGAKTAVEQFIYNVKNLETWQLVMEANWEDTECVQASFEYNSNPIIARRIYMQFKSFPENTKLYKHPNGNYADTPNITYTELIISFKGDGTIRSTETRQVTGDTITINKVSNTAYTFVSDKFHIYQSQNSDTIYDYYFNDLLTRGPQFIPRNYVDIVFYEQTWWNLGYIDGQFDKSKCNFYFYDVTDRDNLYPPMIATLNNGLKLEDDGDLQIETRLIQSYHTYDIYFLYQRR